MNLLFILSRRNFELLEFFLAGLQLAEEHLLHVSNLLLASLNCSIKVGDGFQSPLRRRLILDKLSLEGVVLLLRHDCCSLLI